MLLRARLAASMLAASVVAAACTAAGAGPRGLPTPRPALLRASGSVSVFPAPGTQTASPTTTISFRGSSILDAHIEVFGSRSGLHRGHFLAHSDGNGASFVPDRPFDPGELVNVQSDLRVRGATTGSFGFQIAQPAALTAPPLTTVPANTPPVAAAAVRRFVTRPDLRPPTVTVNTTRTSTDLGDLFLTANPTAAPSDAVQAGPMIVDAQGRLVWFEPHPAATTVDLTVQQYEGRPVLAYFEGTISALGTGAGDIVLRDDTYREIARLRAGNGYAADLHDFEITPQNTVLLLAYNPVRLGPNGRVVLDAIVQELDIASGAVLFEWHSVGNIDLGESYVPAPANGSDAWDYVHANSIALDHDGNIWLSARHTSAVYKIDRVTGALYWRLGGKRSNFDVASDATFMFQHDVRPLDGDTVTVFDNEARAPGVQQRDRSRGLVLHVDEHTMKVTLEHAFESPQGVLSSSQGDLQRLPNGSWLAGWGNIGEYTEYAANGDVNLDASIDAGEASYRAYLLPWTGRPAGPPAVAARHEGTATVVTASWNGATEVARWQVLDGSRVLGTFARTGFETTMRVPPARRVSVRALATGGAVLGASPAVSVG